MDTVDKKKVQSLCKKVLKKCSFNSGADIQNLCHLTYWLFVYGYVDEALSVCEITHDVEFSGKGIWAVWDFIMYMWGLKYTSIRIKMTLKKQMPLYRRWIIFGCSRQHFHPKIKSMKRHAEMDLQFPFAPEKKRFPMPVQKHVQMAGGLLLYLC